MISSGVDEGFSGKAKLTGRKVYGLRTPQGIEIALFHPMGYALPEPEVTRRFCRKPDSQPNDSMQSHAGQGTGIGGE